MTCKIAIYCLLLVALIGLVSAAPPTGRSQQGFKHYCEKRTTSSGNSQYLWGYDTVQLPSDWEGTTEESSSKSKDGAVTTHVNSWYQLTQETKIKCENLKYL
ncbi:hypothetical protein DAPPUDRAFT_309302 [Daphnia pulex]|uniref:Uncharacterized protein n=1 Tax=Daphnia pulex TaxID=6669 RepID=E9HC14_DAPPU|nr:hypothetical protein DAPPUDRAFT_309303 [Daphnia pulex]EFX70740.1 hypothetical protein DAPPUDRAFT_309302 [Daphnia pulex]|eukprot:EFX70688.1 hypothetical protein DAPPUDRAFT_309303 [Daphnia pulex]